MDTERSAEATVEVGVDPATAFRVFTEEIGSWWGPGPINFFDAARATGMAVEPSVGGRVLELYGDKPPLVIATVTAWEPGSRVVYRGVVDDTETVVTFSAIEHGAVCASTNEPCRGAPRLPVLAERHRLVRFLRCSATRRHPGESDMNDVVPMLTYADGPAAMDWLASAFGFEEQTRWLDDDGRVAHGELRAGDGLVMVASTNPAYEGPSAHRRHCESADAWLSSPYVVDGALVMVDDIDAHYARAVAAGAPTLSEIESGGPGRLYRTEDLEGHRWMFMQRG